MDAKATYETHRASALQTIEEIEKAIRNQRFVNVNWANVGDIATIDEKLQNILDQINQTGEYAS